MDKRLPSLRKRYIALALILVMIAGSWSFLSYQKVRSTQYEISVDLNNIRLQRNKLVTIQKKYFILYQNIDLFLLNPLGGTAKLDDNILLVLNELNDQKKLFVSNDTELIFLSDNLVDSIASLKSELKSLVATRMDVTRQYPGLALAAFGMSVPQQSVNNGFRILIDEIENGGFEPVSKNLYPMVLKAQTLWAQTVSQLRIYTTNRLASFTSTALQQQAKSLEDIYQQLVKTLVQLDVLYSQEDSFIGPDTLLDIIVKTKLWRNKFTEARRLLEMEDWRRDTYIMRTVIIPLSIKIMDDFRAIEQLLFDREANFSIIHENNSRLLTRLLTGLIFLFIAFIAGLIISIDWLIFRPLHHLSELLNARALGSHGNEIPVPKTYELGNLVIAYQDMDQQISTRQKALEKQTEKLEKNELKLINYRDHLEEMVVDRTAEINSIVNTAADAILSIDSNGIVKTFNKAAENIFGYQADEILGQSVNKLISQEHSIHHNSYINHYLSSGRGGIIGKGRELEAKRKDGSIFPIYISVSEMNIGGKRHFTGIIRDITEQKKAESKLRESEKIYRAIFQQSSDAIVILNNNNLFDCNPATLKLFGCSDKETFLGLTIEDLSPETQPDGKPTTEAKKYYFSKAKQNGSILYEWHHKRHDDHREVITEILLSLITWKGNDAFQAVIRDIGLRKQSEMELKKSKELAESASKLKSQFVANVSHEIRTPMNAIIGFSEIILKDTGLSNKSRKNIEKIESASKALLVIINDILDLSKLESGKLSFESVCFYLANFVSEILHTFSKQAEENAIELNMNYASSLPQKIFGDPTRLRQVLTNLLSNAIKFTEHGIVSINIKRFDQDKILFEVSDTGIGMTNDQLDNIFEAFAQADASTTRRFGGTGLGTSISKQLVEQMGGKIWVESELGKGSNFFFTIDLDIAPDTESNCLFADVATRSNEVFETASSDKQGRKEKILLVEDNVFNQELISQQLLACGYESDIADNGESGKKMWLEGHYALILSDISMPVMDGYQLVDFIRQYETDKEKRTTVIAMTANAMVGEKDKCLEKGFDDYISKPMAIDQLKQIVNHWINQK